MNQELTINDLGWCDQAQQQPSPNCDARPDDAQISLLVIHNISLPPNEFGGEWITDLFLNRLDSQAHPYFETIHTFEVSSHFLIRRDGELLQYVSCLQRAWHAGASEWRGVSRCNDYSVGIELEGADSIPFTKEQYQMLNQITSALRHRYETIDSIAAHSEIAPTRKTDPGSGFEWARYEYQSKIPKAWRSNKK